MMKNKILITGFVFLILILSLSILTAEETEKHQQSNKETLTKDRSIDAGFIVDRVSKIPNIWPNEKKVSKDKRRQIEIDYLAKAKQLDPNQEWLTALRFVRRLNINKLDTFSKLQVDYKYAAKSSHGTSYKEHALDAQVIIIGTIDKINILDSDEYFYNIIYKVKIDRIIGGENYLLPNEEYLFIQGKPTFPLLLKKNEKGLLFLTRVYWNDFDPNNKLLNNKKFHEIAYERNSFLPVTFSTIQIKQDRSIKNTDYDAKRLPIIYDKKTGETKVGITLEEVIKEVKKIYEINDTYNFFNREYK